MMANNLLDDNLNVAHGNLDPFIAPNKMKFSLVAERFHSKIRSIWNTGMKKQQNNFCLLRCLRIFVFVEFPQTFPWNGRRSGKLEALLAKGSDLIHRAPSNIGATLWNLKRKKINYLNWNINFDLEKVVE